MDGTEVAKQAVVAFIITLVAGSGIMLIPLDERYLRAGYCVLLALSLTSALFLPKRKPEWVRTPLKFFSVALTIIAVAIAAGG